MKEMEEWKDEIEKNRKIEKLKRLLDGRTAVGYYSPKEFEIGEEGRYFFNEQDFLFVLPVHKMVRYTWLAYKEKVNSGWYIVIDMNKLELNSVITLEVPKGKENLFIGNKFWQVKSWCRKLKQKYISVVGI